MKKTTYLLISTIAFTAFSAQAVNPLDLMNLSKEQSEAIQSARQQQREAELKAQQEIVQQAPQPQLAQQPNPIKPEAKQTTEAPQTPIPAVIPSSIMATIANTKGTVNVSNDADLNALRKQYGEIQAAQEAENRSNEEKTKLLHEQNSQRMLREFAEIEKQINGLENPFPDMK